MKTFRFLVGETSERLESRGVWTDESVKLLARLERQGSIDHQVSSLLFEIALVMGNLWQGRQCRKPKVRNPPSLSQSLLRFRLRQKQRSSFAVADPDVPNGHLQSADDEHLLC